MSTIRKINKVIKSKPVIEGAGVHLQRVFGFNEVSGFDPFLLLDDFRSDTPEYYVKGFPWHPHRGIETITYVLKGEVEHSDSLGNKGVIGPGDVQWMTAGSGIIHQEMPKGDEDKRMYGFQLWANLPQNQKMMAPRYQEIPSNEIPKVSLSNGVLIRVIAGEISGKKGPVGDIVIDPEYLDVNIPPHAEFRHLKNSDYTLFAYVIDGKGDFTEEEKQSDMTFIENGSVILFHEGDEIIVRTSEEGLRFLLISGKPLNEPIAWRGPIVMNTQKELDIAFEEYQNGTFIKAV